MEKNLKSDLTQRLRDRMLSKEAASAWRQSPALTLRRRLNRAKDLAAKRAKKMIDPFPGVPGDGNPKTWQTPKSTPST